MLTQCPKCETIYRLGAADLAAAQGFVECGECGDQFNALERIADEPTFSTEQKPERDPAAVGNPADVRAPSGPAFVLLESEALAETGADVPVSEEDTVIDLEPAVSQSEQGTLFDLSSPAHAEEETIFEVAPAAATVKQTPIDVGVAELAANVTAEIASPQTSAPQPAVDSDQAGTPTQRLSESEHAILFTDPRTDFEDEAEDEIESLDNDDVPAILQEEVKALGRPPRRSLSVFWGSLTLVFIAGLGFQAGWVFRAQIITALPDARPVYAAVCERLGCSYEPIGVPGTIELLSRDVRDHPQYLETLLVNATLISRSDTTTAFPVIQLGLYGQTGEAIGVRRFEPIEYLDKSIELAAGMPPNRPVYIVMEIGGVGNRAVSFEFTFL